MNETVEPLLQEPLWETVLYFIPRALLEGTFAETALALCLCGLGIYFGMVLLFLAIETLKRSLPWYANQPPGWPSWKRNLVKIGITGEPREFAWRYPHLMSDRLELDFSAAMQDLNDPRKYLLKTGTVLEFIPRKKPGKKEEEGEGDKAAPGGKKKT